MDTSNTNSQKCDRIFMSQCLKEGFRVDHRNMTQVRSCSLTLLGEYGPCLIELGKTRVSCEVCYELVPPNFETPNAGFIETSVTIVPLSGPMWNRPQPKNNALSSYVTEVVEHVLKTSGCIDPSTMVVIPGKVVGSLRIDLSIHHDDGNIIDCAVLAAHSALGIYKRPDISSCNGLIVLHPERNFIPFSVHHLPITLTYGITEDNKIIITDCTHDEAAVLHTFVSIMINRYGELCGLRKQGGSTCTQSTIMKCIDLSKEQAKFVFDGLQRVVENYTVLHKNVSLKDLNWARKNDQEASHTLSFPYAVNMF